jgi:hypothetical protein
VAQFVWEPRLGPIVGSGSICPPSVARELSAMFFACSGGAGMRRTTMLWEVFVRRIEEAFEQYEKHRLTGEEAGELLGGSIT